MRVTFFRVAERKSPKKGRPYCLRPLRCATGQPAVLAFRGVSQNSLRCAALRQLRALIRETLRSSAQPEGVGRAFASLGLGMPLGPSLRSASCPLSLWERVRVRAPGLTNVATVSTAQCPHPSPLPEGEGTRQTQGRAKRWPERHSKAERSKGPNAPLWLCRGAQGKAGSGPQLSERNEVQRVLRTPAFPEHRRLPAAKRRDTDSGVAFFCLLFLARQEK